MPVEGNSEGSLVEYQSLLKLLAEDLKLPLTRIARQAELVELGGETAKSVLGDVHLNASSALELIDGYLLGLKLASSQQTLQLEPVSTMSVVYDVAQQLNVLARHYRVELAVQLGTSLEPVMANADGLKAALLSLGTAMIEAQTPAKRPPIVTIASRKRPNGIVTGWYASDAIVSPAELRTATDQSIDARRQPLKTFPASGAAGIFVAQKILAAMSVRLGVARYDKQSGLAAILQPSRQLSLV